MNRDLLINISDKLKEWSYEIKNGWHSQKQYIDMEGLSKLIDREIEKEKNK